MLLLLKGDNLLCHKNLTLEDKIKNRLDELIPDLIEDEDIDKLIKEALERVIFKERREGENYNVKYKMPLLCELVQDAFKPVLVERIDKWLNENRQYVLTAIDKQLTSSMSKAICDAIDNKFNSIMINFRENVTTSLFTNNY